jgi:hypothetical protein
MVKRTVSATLVSILFCLFAFTASAQYIPPGMEERVLSLVSPYGVDSPADALGADAVISSIAIEQQIIRITIKSDAATGVLTLASAPLDEEPPAKSQGSFAVYLDDALVEGTLAQPTSLLLSAIAKNDNGRFWGQLPEPAELGATSPVPEIEGAGYAWYDFIGEVLLLILLVLLGLIVPVLVRSLGGRPVYYWLALVLAVGFGFALRFFVIPSPEKQPEQPDEVCSADHHCDDFSPCTADRCVDQLCQSDWAPPPGSNCCQTDEDCGASGDPCLRSFCSLESHLCADEPLPECNVEPYAGQSRPPLDTSVGWLLAIPAKWSGNTMELAGTVNRLASSMSTLLIGLIPIALGAPTGVALGAALLYATSPAYLAAANTYSMTGLLTFLFLLLLLLWSLQTNRKGLSDKQRWFLTAASGLLLLLLIAARLEMLFVWLVLLAAGCSNKMDRSRYWLHLGVAGAAGLLTFVIRLAVTSTAELELLVPGIAPQGPLASLMVNVDLLFLQGVVIPFFVLLGALGGLVLLRNQQRQLFGLSLAMLALLFLPLFFDLTPFQLVRYIAIPSLSLAFLAGTALWWIGQRKVKLAWLAVFILVLYFALFPFTRLDIVRNLGRTPDLLSHFHQL